MIIKFMSFNIQSCRNYMTRKFSSSQVINAIKLYSPDIIGLNEVRGKKTVENADESWFSQLKEISNGLGYKYFYHGIALNLSGPYGNAIISKYPIDEIETIPIPDPLIKDEKAFYESRCIIKAKILNFTVLVTHIGLARSEQTNGINKLLEIINSNNTNIVLMGDFNMTPDNNHIKTLSNYLIDTSIYFENPSLSFPSINPKVKIDYIFVSKGFTILKSFIPKIVASDHYPYIIDCDIK